MIDQATLSHLWRRFLSTGAFESAFDDLVAHYNEPHRHYHTLAHVSEVLFVIDLYYPDSPRWLILAAFYHDVIYDPTSKTNEVDSAAFAKAALGQILSPEELSNLARAIELTATHDLNRAESVDEALVVGDLYSLSIDPQLYRANTALIRAEYSMFSDREWARGRRAFIERFLSRPSLPTEARFEALESAIRENLLDELARMDSPSS